MKHIPWPEILLVIALCLIFACGLANAFGTYDADLIEVKDGDTVRLRIYVWPGNVIETDVRLAGVNTPESRPRQPKGMSKAEWEPLKSCEKGAATAAKSFTEHFLSGKRLTVPAVHPGDTKFYGRINAEISADGEDLGAALIAAGHARPYSGGARSHWCTNKGNRYE